MLVGLTYDLREWHAAAACVPEDLAEYDRPETIDAVEAALVRMGHRVVRIGNGPALMERLAAGERWDLVFNLAEGASGSGVGREAQVPALLDLVGVPYTFSDPLVCALALHKGLCKRVVRDAGVPTPDFALIEHAGQIDGIDLPFPLFVKPVAEGSSKGVSGRSLVHTRGQLRRVCVELMGRFRQGVLVERYLPGREFTVGILGTGDRARALGAMEVHLLADAEPGAYSYANKQDYARVVRYTLVDDQAGREACAAGLAAWRVLGGRDAGRVDLRADEAGRVQFLEVNVLPGLDPERSDLPILARLCGMDYDTLLEHIVASAVERVEEHRGPRACLPGTGPTTAGLGRARRHMPQVVRP